MKRTVRHTYFVLISSLSSTVRSWIANMCVLRQEWHTPTSASSRLQRLSEMIWHAVICAYFMNTRLRYKLSRWLFSADRVSFFFFFLFSSLLLYLSVGKLCMFLHIKMQAFCVCVCRENRDLWAGKTWLARAEDHTSLGLLSKQRRQAPSLWLTGCQQSLSAHKTCDQPEVKGKGTSLSFFLSPLAVARCWYFSLSCSPNPHTSDLHLTSISKFLKPPFE